MAQVDIVTINNATYREYEIEPGDNLSSICLRFGHRDWNEVYNLDVNSDFRTRFPDPDQIDYVNSENLFIPLVAVTPGTSVTGTRSSDFYVVKIYNEDGSKANSGIKFKHIYDKDTAAGTATLRDVQTDSNGEIIISNPPAGDNYLASGDYILVNESTVYEPVLLSSTGTFNSTPDPTDHLLLNRNSTDEVTLRQVYYITCAMCGRDYMTVKPNDGDPDNVCPDDDFNLTEIEDEIDSNLSSFTSPATGQNPRSSGNVCRGINSLVTIHGSVNVYWDESRFVQLNDGDYSLYDAVGGLKIDIIGRSTWGATVLNPDTSLRWAFQETATGASPPYTFAIPNNEVVQLGNSLFYWMTIHHTTDTGQGSSATVQDLQVKHQNLSGDEDETYADIAYHYLIDTDGKIYECRPLGIKGSHATLFNGGNVGIVLAGDFESRIQNGWSPDSPTTAALSSLDNITQVLSSRFNIISVWSHQERSVQVGLDKDYTECCGDNLIVYVNGTLRTRYSGPPL